MLRLIAVATSAVVAGAGMTYAFQDTAEQTHREELASVVREVEALDELRSGLAGAFTGEPDQATFAQVCGPVGAKARQLEEEHGWKVQQLAAKYRNPGRDLDAEAEHVYGVMLQDPEIMGLWVRSEMDGKTGTRYFRRIVVERACLSCHGAKDERPQFVKENYPHDRAYGFEVGDLRGLYAVFVAD